jgi:nucleotide-binding universal stress UspA family protein
VVPNLVPPQAAESVERLTADAKHELGRFLQATHVTVPLERTVIRFGDLLEELNAYIQTEAIDLVVIGSSGRTGPSRLILGSMAEYIFRGLEAPVLAMGPQATHPPTPGRGLQHLVLCESLVPDAERAMRYGCALAEEVGAAVTVVHTLPASLKDSPRAPLFQRMFEEELRTGATRPALFAKADYIVTFGDPAREVVRVAKSVRADLIVLGAKPAEMWQTHLGRGTAYRIVGAAPCPILSVRSLPNR